MKTNIRYQWTLGMILAFCLAGISAYTQKINYSEPEREDTRRTNFEIIGRVGGNFLVFKNNRGENDISVYDYNMKLLNRVHHTDPNDRWINVDFVSYPDFAWMVYQLQRKNMVYCYAVKIDGNGKRLTNPIELDTTRIGWSASNKIYSLIFSEDKQQIMLFKINNRDPSNFLITTLLFDAQMQLRYKHHIGIPMEERNEYFTDFLIDNEGDFVFAKFVRRSGSDYTSDVVLVTKKSDQESFRQYPIPLTDQYLDAINIKLDNSNRRIILNSFYYSQRRGHVDGLRYWIWGKDSLDLLVQRELSFNEEMRKMAKGPDANLKSAFNDYIITKLITRKDGGYIVVSEAAYTTSRGNVYDRWGNRLWNNPWLSPMDYYYWSPYYSPYSSFYWDRWNYGRGFQQGTRYHSENVFLMSFDPQGNLEWSNAIPKNQFDDESDALISHLVFVSGNELQLLFNLYERRNLLLNNQGVKPDGTINRYPTLKNLDRDIEFMPRFGKQVSTKVVIVPCLSRNTLIFAKIEF